MWYNSPMETRKSETRSWALFTSDLFDLSPKILNPSEINAQIANYRNPALVNGDRRRAFDKLFKSSIRLIHRAITTASPYSVPYEDILGEAYEMFERTVARTFQPGHVSDLDSNITTSYPTFLFDTLKIYLTSPRTTIREFPVQFPYYVLNFIDNLQRTEDRLTTQLGRQPAKSEIIAEISKRKTFAKSDTTSIYTHVQPFVDPDLSVSIERSTVSIPDEQIADEIVPVTEIIPDPAPDPEQSVLDSENNQDLMTAFASLRPNEREVLIYRLGLGRNPETTLQDIGDRFGVSRERIRQIEVRALKKLRNKPQVREIALQKGWINY